MRFNSFWVIVSVILLGSMVAYFAFNPSYQRSLEAKIYFALGEYDEAQKYATEAFELNSYNRMAATIMTQSQTAMKFVNYNNQAKKFKEQISSLAQEEAITEAQRAKIRTMCLIMMDEYTKIAPSVVIDKALVDEAKQHYEEFLKLYEKVS
jgi:tetratricopeptide (TPR) repeat protein